MSTDRPYVFIHVIPSMDGKITGNIFKTQSLLNLRPEYWKTKYNHEHDAWLVGRATFDSICTHNETVDLSNMKAECEEGDYIAKRNLDMVAIVVNPKGKLGWKENVAHYWGHDSDIIEVLINQSTPQYRNYLRSIGISYIMCGDHDVDWKLMFSKLKNVFNIKAICVQGGGMINWSLMRTGLVDELSYVIAPTTDGRSTDVSFIRRNPEDTDSPPLEFDLIDVQRVGDNGVWLRYAPKKN
ncbi:hypothetical protein TVAG_291040 [Trichomonas vaginalis G3]|uniref:Bacterial bifunctional deaminase-reductase C-terminal domain-containing protein n=1 Tax=Trichomonas vaginalis (strain ATCC PRA-98 / G3) TaxID=412133 RepID=A2F3Y2_TRIV3|nr:cupin domain-containing protein family [Trichomonas vaginalis G3]EAY00398.1 hypothetical protein TVAG_291040 [Trichomonas vaginalis G3]KAI5528367.1 cupin domain-containing protein family [Trichomonas vaginalis G3]|eukprot:XP_001313327.1 hypothetical protein [Trichomonas vaginalis G3]